MVGITSAATAATGQTQQHRNQCEEQQRYCGYHVAHAGIELQIRELH